MKCIKKYFLLLVVVAMFCTQPLISVAQNEFAYRDSLLKKLSFEKTDSGKAKILFFIGRNYWFKRQLNDAEKTLYECVSLSEKINYGNYLCDAKLLLAHIAIRSEKFDTAFSLLENTITCSETFKQEENIAKAYEAYCILYKLIDDFETAIDYGLKAIILYEKFKQGPVYEQTIFVSLEVGKLFEQLQQNEKANFYYTKALNIANQSGKTSLLKAPKICIANNLFLQNKLSDAEKIYAEVLHADRLVKGTEPTMEALSGLGKICIQKKNYPLAKQYFKAALDTALNRGFLISADGYALSVATVYLLSKEYDSARYFFQKSITLANGHNDLRVQQAAYKHLSTLECELNNFAKAYSWLKYSNQIADSIFNIEKLKSVNKIETAYHVKQKEKAITELDLLNKKKELEILKRNRILFIGAISIIALIVFIVLLYRNHKIKYLLAQKEQSEKQKQIDILEQQQQIISLQSMVNGEEQERTRIAKDLHDGLGGLFSTIKMYFISLQKDYPQLEQNDLFIKNIELINTASVEVRKIAHNMMPEVLLRLGLEDAVKELCNNINAGKLIKVNFQAYGMEKRLATSTEIMLYRIIQELLNNIMKHANASEAIVQFNMTEKSLIITVEDNGDGFNTKEADEKTTAGLSTVHNRVSYLNGKLLIESDNGVGTTVTMEFLLNNI